MAPVLLILFIPLLMGLVSISCLWPIGKSFLSHVMLKLSFGIGIGFGVFSCFFFVWLSVFGPSSRGLIPALIVIVLLMAAILAYRVRKSGRLPARELSTEPLPKLKLRWILGILFLVSIVFGVASFVFLSLKKPHGDWDAWAIWNLRARFLFRGGDQWTSAFSGLLEAARPDYPLLVPSAIAGLWTCIGNDTVLVPVLLSFLFTFAAVGLTVSSLAILRGKNQAFLAGVILLGTPFLITHGESQYADVPLAFFFLGTLIFLALQDRLTERSYNFLILAGLTAGLAAWTKNEGIIFIAAISVARLMTVAPKKGLRSYLRQMLSFTAGLAPALLIIIYFKLRLAPANYLMAQGSQTTLQKLMDVSRHLQVWNAFAKQLVDFGGWAVSVPLLLIFYILFSGVSMKETERPGIIASLLALVFMLVAYALTLVVTPFDIAWQLSTSLNRLLLQLWPSLIFVYFLIARPIELARASQEPGAA